MITPTWVSSFPVSPGRTTFELQLSKSADTAMLSTHLKEIKPSLLLFLRKLRAVTIDGPLGPQGRYAIINISREDVDADVVKLSRMGGKPTTEKYLKVTHNTNTYTKDEKRKDVTESEIVLAFPLNENEEPLKETQSVHAFLPLKSCGFPVSCWTTLCTGFFIDNTYSSSFKPISLYQQTGRISCLNWNGTSRSAMPYLPHSW